MRESSEVWYSNFWRRDGWGSWVHWSVQGTKGPFVSPPVGSWRKPTWRTWVLHGPKQLPGLEKEWATTRHRFLADSPGALQLPCALKRRDRRRLLVASKECSKRSLRAPRSSTHQQPAPHTLGSISREKGRGALTPLHPSRYTGTTVSVTKLDKIINQIGVHLVSHFPGQGPWGRSKYQSDLRYQTCPRYQSRD